MKILSTAKNVIDVELNITVKDGQISTEGMQYVMNAWDENAVETAVQLKENYQAETYLVTIGNDDSTTVIRKGLAMGIDHALQINDPTLKLCDSSAFAKILAQVVKQGGYDLIITGKQAQDTDNGTTGIMLAEYADLPCVSNVIAIEVVDEMAVKVSRLGDEGTEIIDLQLPAVITVNDSINEPRLPALRGIMMAKKKKIEVMDLSTLGISSCEIQTGVMGAQVLEYSAPEARKTGQLFEGDVTEITQKVVYLLANEAKVI